jgi:hypothetical protein
LSMAAIALCTSSFWEETPRNAYLSCSTPQRYMPGIKKGGRSLLSYPFVSAYSAGLGSTGFFTFLGISTRVPSFS